MRLSNLSPSTQLALTIIVPIICITIAALTVLPAAFKLDRVDRDLTTTEDAIRRKQANISRMAVLSQGWRPELAVAKASDQEPILFWRQLAAVAADSGVALMSVRETTPPPLPEKETSLPPGAAPAGSLTGTATSTRQQTSATAGTSLAGQRPVVPATVREATLLVVAEGTFNQLLEFITRLERFSERIMTVSQCRLDGGGRTYPRLRATFTLSRFVSTGAPAAATSTGSGSAK